MQSIWKNTHVPARLMGGDGGWWEGWDTWSTAVTCSHLQPSGGSLPSPPSGMCRWGTPEVGIKIVGFLGADISVFNVSTLMGLCSMLIQINCVTKTCTCIDNMWHSLGGLKKNCKHQYLVPKMYEIKLQKYFFLKHSLRHIDTLFVQCNTNVLFH